ncbi:MAG: hypothetical protein ACI9S8_002641, partial [Chlamydiales bacterium]
FTQGDSFDIQVLSACRHGACFIGSADFSFYFCDIGPQGDLTEVGLRDKRLAAGAKHKKG